MREFKPVESHSALGWLGCNDTSVATGQVVGPNGLAISRINVVESAAAVSFFQVIGSYDCCRDTRSFSFLN
jgi:hypothetical protein